MAIGRLIWRRRGEVIDVTTFKMMLSVPGGELVGHNSKKERRAEDSQLAGTSDGRAKTKCPILPYPLPMPVDLI